MKKSSFSEVYAQSGIGYGELNTVAALANVERYTLNQLLLQQPVQSTEAQSVLNILSQLSGQQYTLGSVNIPVLEGQVQS